MADSDNNQDGANSSAARTDEASQGASGTHHVTTIDSCLTVEKLSLCHSSVDDENFPLSFFWELNLLFLFRCDKLFFHLFFKNFSIEILI